MSSFESINYNIRVNKSIERKMICEMLSRLSLIDALSNYRYIGFGATYFADFNLIHKQLGINDLISIEKEEDKRQRFEFNKPFDCIKLEFGSSTDILPNLELGNKKNIIWLDYDGAVRDYIFDDINIMVSSMMEGSVFLISANVEIPKEKGNKDRPPLEILFEKVGKERVPIEFQDVVLTRNKYISLVYQMINMQIHKSLLERNGVNEQKLEYKQIFNFLYQDGAPMLTVGGIIYGPSQKQSVNKMKLEELKYFRSAEDIYKIKCPNLTYKEIQVLNNLLPCMNIVDESKNMNDKFDIIPLNSNDIVDYAEIYRYYPNFAETNI